MKIVLDLAIISETGLLIKNKYTETFYSFLLKNPDEYKKMISIIKNLTKNNKGSELIIEQIDFANRDWTELTSNILHDVVSTNLPRPNIKQVSVSHWHELAAQALGSKSFKEFESLLKIELNEFADYSVGLGDKTYKIPAKWFSKGFRKAKLLPMIFYLEFSKEETTHNNEDFFDCWTIMYFFEHLKDVRMVALEKTQERIIRRHTAKDTLRNEKNAKIKALELKNKEQRILLKKQDKAMDKLIKQLTALGVSLDCSCCGAIGYKKNEKKK